MLEREKVETCARSFSVKFFFADPYLYDGKPRIHFTAQNRRPGICEMKEAVETPPSPLPVATVDNK